MKKVLTILIVLIILGMLAGGGFVGLKLYERYSEGEERADLYDYFELSKNGQGAIMLNNQILQEKCRILNERCYLELATIQQYLHNRFYYTEVSREIRYTDATTIVTAPLDGGSFTSITGGVTESFEEPYTIALVLDGTCYIALDFVEKYVPVTHEVFREPDRVVIASMGLCREMVTVASDTAVRWRAGVKSEILTDVLEGDMVELLDAESIEGWTRVATGNGFIGYIRNKRLGDRAMVTGADTLSYQAPAYEATLMDEGIRMGFHGVYNMTANGNLDEVLETAFNINVISPTWFFLSDNAGNFDSLASAEYVAKAHERGVQVWALVEDITNKANLDMYQLLADSTTRTALIDNLVAVAIEYDLDGLNIDLESVRQKAAPHFIQFLRELSIPCREHDIVLSIDNYPPNSGNAYFDYGEQGVVADYVVLMGYDEHWHGSGDPGSTASEPFVSQSLDSLTSMVPAERVIHALPFYTRLWKTESKEVTDQTVLMKNVDETVSELGMKIDFDAETGQKYASAEKDGVRYQMWIEDYASMENKLKLAERAGVAGVAAWRLGYEKPEVWELIGSYIH